MRRYNRTKILSIFKGRQQRKKERDRDKGQEERGQRKNEMGKESIFYCCLPIECVFCYGNMTQNFKLIFCH